MSRNPSRLALALAAAGLLAGCGSGSVTVAEAPGQRAGAGLPHRSV